jgi:CHAT domain-containing protein/Tfp pilus assembly protein PilF
MNHVIRWRYRAAFLFAAFAWPSNSGTAFGSPQESSTASESSELPSGVARARWIIDRQRFLNELAKLIEQKKWDEAIALNQQKLTLSREALGELDYDTIATLSMMGGFHEARGDMATAKKIRLEVIALLERRPDRKEWRIADARAAIGEGERRAARSPEQRAQLKKASDLILLASRLNSIHDYRAALEKAQEATRIFREVVGEDDIDFARGLSMTGYILRAQGQHARAEPLQRQALDIFERARGASHPTTASYVTNLAEVYHKMGDYARAEPLYRRALAILTEAYGYADRNIFNELLRLGHFFLEKGDLSQAEPLIRQLHAVTMTMYDLGDYDNGVHPAELAARLSQQLYGPLDPRHAESLGLQARLFLARGDYAKAEPLLRQAYEIQRKAKGDAHPDCALARSALAGLYRAKGDFARAEPMIREAMERMKTASGVATPEYASALGGMASLLRERGELAAAEPLLLQALEIRKKAQGADHPDAVASLNDLANLYRDQGDFSRAEPLYREVLEIASRTKSFRHRSSPSHTRALRDLAELYRVSGQYARAVPLLRLSVANHWTQGDLNLAAGLDALASLYLDMGDDLRAEEVVGQALAVQRKVQGESHPGYAATVGLLARIYLSRGDLARAEPLFRQALGIQRKALDASHPGQALALCDMAGCLEARGDHARAEPLLRQALEIRRKVQGDSHPDFARNLVALARVIAARGDLPGAEPLFRQALDIEKRVLGESHPDHAAALGDLAELKIAQNDFAAAEPLFRQALDLTSARRRKVSTTLGERQRLRLWAASRRFLDGYLSAALRVKSTPEDLYSRVLDGKGTVSAELAEERLVRDQPELRLRLRELALVRANLARLAYSPAFFDDPSSPLHNQYARLNTRKEDLEAELAARSALLLPAKPEPAPGPEQVTRSLRNGEGLIDLFEYFDMSAPGNGKGPLHRERRLLAFVVRPGRPVALIPLGPAQPVAEAVQSWRGAVVHRQPRTLQAAATSLARRVWDPLRPHLEGATTLFVASDGALLSFPFAALPGKQPGSYLIEDRTIGYVTSGRQLIDMRSGPSAPPGRGLLAVGGVDYQADAGGAKLPDPVPPVAPEPPAPPRLFAQRGGFAPLPGTGPEAESVQARYRAVFADQPADLLTGSGAMEAELKRRLDGGQIRVVHLATHGFFHSLSHLAELRAKFRRLDPSSRPVSPADEASDREISALTPLVRSGIVLTGGNVVRPAAIDFYKKEPGNEDGILTAEEVQALDLRGTELVVLSACETGLGDLEAGQGVLGLQRAFEAAGAEAVVASLWQVDDAATSLLMDRFYTNLWTKRLPRLEALRQAQLDVLRNPSLVQEKRTQLAKRGIAKAAEPLPEGKLDPPSPPSETSDPALWAAFLLSGKGW